MDDIAAQLPTLLSAEDVAIPLEMAVFTSLWGNKMDLSLWPSKSVSAKDGNNVTVLLLKFYSFFNSYSNVMNIIHIAR